MPRALLHAERCLARIEEAEEEVNPHILAFINRLSDLLYIMARLEEREVASRAFTQYEERFQFPLGLALLLLLIDFALPDRVRTKRGWEGRFA